MDQQLKHRPKEQQSVHLTSTLDRRFWRLWFLLVGISMLSIAALAVTLGTTDSSGKTAWPWSGTGTILLSALFLLTVIFAAYMTHQQRKIVHLRRRLQEMQHKSRELSRRHRNRLVAFYSVSAVVGRQNDPQKVFDYIVRLCKQVFEAEHVSLMVLDPKTKMLEVRAAQGHENPGKVIGSKKRLGEGISGWVAQNMKPLLLGGAVSEEKFPGHQVFSDGIASAMVVPLIVRDEVSGVLSISNSVAGIEYDEEDLDAIRVFSEIAEYSIRHNEQSTWMRQTIESLRHRGTSTSASVNSPV